MPRYFTGKKVPFRLSTGEGIVRHHVRRWAELLHAARTLGDCPNRSWGMREHRLMFRSYLPLAPHPFVTGAFQVKA
jgi:hypothetical protein